MRKSLIFVAVSCTLLLAASCGGGNEPFKAPVRMIIDTDLGNDIDDALALALAMRGVDEGKIDLLAVGCHKKSPTAAPYADVVCTWYGHPEVEVAMSLTPVKETSSYCDYSVVESHFKRSRSEYPDPVKVYRKALAASPDHSVCVVSLGFGVNLAALLESAPDEFSPLDGVALVARKTSGLSVMAGSYGEKKRAEYNVINDIPSMQAVFAKWPTAIWQNPFEIGKQVMFPWSAIEEKLGYNCPNPIVDAYTTYRDIAYDRPSWDMLSVLFPLRPELFTLSAPGTITVDDEGYTWYAPCKDGKHFVLSATIDQPQALLEAELEMAMKAVPSNCITAARVKKEGAAIAASKKLICFDLDATLTAHRTPIEDYNLRLLDTLRRKYEVIMVCAGNCPRVYAQMRQYPITILGNYGMMESTVENGEFKIVREDVFPADTAFFLKQNDYLRAKYGYTEYFGEPLEFHKTGMVTMGLLGTTPEVEAKHNFDPDRSKRRAMYPEVCEIFKDYSVYIGGSSSFDFSAKQYNKYDAVMAYAAKHGYSLDEVLFVGDDFDDGGGDSHVRIKGMDYIAITDYTKAPVVLSFLY